MKQRDIKKIRYTPDVARRVADEVSNSLEMQARAQEYIGKLQSATERTLVHEIYLDLCHLKIGKTFWLRLQTAAMLRQRNAHFKAATIALVEKERDAANKALTKKKTVLEKLTEHKDEILELSNNGMNSKEIAAYIHKTHRGQFTQHGSPHYKTVQEAIRSFKATD